jgi:hypothetical protein
MGGERRSGLRLRWREPGGFERIGLVLRMLLVGDDRPQHA